MKAKQAIREAETLWLYFEKPNQAKLYGELKEEIKTKFGTQTIEQIVEIPVEASLRIRDSQWDRQEENFPVCIINHQFEADFIKAIYILGRGKFSVELWNDNDCDLLREKGLRNETIFYKANGVKISQDQPYESELQKKAKTKAIFNSRFKEAIRLE